MRGSDDKSFPLWLKIAAPAALIATAAVLAVLGVKTALVTALWLGLAGLSYVAMDEMGG